MTFTENFNCDLMQQTSEGEGCKIMRGLSGQKTRESSDFFRQVDLVEIRVAHIEHLTNTPAIV